MLKVTSLNAYGVSRIKIDGMDRDVVSFSASVDSNSGTYSISKSVSDRETYDAHKQDCDADFEAFETYIAEMSSQKG